MRGLGWLALTVLFLAASWGFAARTAILDLRRDREWQPVAWPAEGGELNGVRAAIVALDAVSTPVRPRFCAVRRAGGPVVAATG